MQASPSAPSAIDSHQYPGGHSAVQKEGGSVYEFVQEPHGAAAKQAKKRYLPQFETDVLPVLPAVVPGQGQ